MANNSASLDVLLKLTGAGDQKAFARLYQLTSAHLLGVAHRILGRQQVAEDALQDAFVSVWKRAAQYDPGLSQPMTWLITIVRNQAIDVVRAEKRRAEVSNESTIAHDDDESNVIKEYSAESSGSPSQLEQLSTAVEAMQIKDCIGTLDAPCRQSVALAYYRGLSHTEVAAHMKVPLGTIKTWIRRGLEQLKFCLVTRGVEK